MKSQSDTSSNSEIKGLPQGELFSLSGHSGPIYDLPEVKAYWKSLYNKYTKLRNTEANNQQICFFVVKGEEFIPLCVHFLKENRIQFYDDGQEIETEKFIEKVKSLICFI